MILRKKKEKSFNYMKISISNDTLLKNNNIIYK